MSTPAAANPDSPPSLGAMVTVAGPSTGKPIFFGVLHLIAAVALGMPGFVMIYIGLTEHHEDSQIMLAIGAPFTLVGVLYLLAAIRRFRVAGDSRMFLRAGPSGFAVCMPDNRGIAGFFRLAFPLRTHEHRWDEIQSWYPFRRTVNGIPTETSIQFESKAGWRLDVNTMFFGASQSTLVDGISAAIKSTAHTA